MHAHTTALPRRRRHLTRRATKEVWFAITNVRTTAKPRANPSVRWIRAKHALLRPASLRSNKNFVGWSGKTRWTIEEAGRLGDGRVVLARDLARALPLQSARSAVPTTVPKEHHSRTHALTRHWLDGAEKLFTVRVRTSNYSLLGSVWTSTMIRILPLVPERVSVILGSFVGTLCVMDKKVRTRQSRPTPALADMERALVE